MPCFDDVVFIIGFFSGCIVSVLIFIWFYLFDKLTDIMQERKQKKKRFEFSPQILDYNSFLLYIGSRDENFYRRFVEWENRSLRLEKLLDQVVDYINDNECSVKDDD